MDSGADDLVVDQATQPPHSLVEEGRKLAGTCSACLRPHLAQSGGFRIESKEEDEARKPCWHPLKRHVFHAGFVVVEALGEKAYQPQTYLGLLKDQALHV